MKRKNNKKYLIVLLILFISIGFAYLSANLNISGLAVIKRSVWDVHFENIVNENEDVLNIDTPAVISNNKLRVDFEVSLDQPGQEYSFYVDVLNNSTFDVALSNLSITGLDSSLENYIIPTVTYSDGITPLQNDILKENSLETLRVSVKYNDNLTENDLPSIDNDFTLTVELKYNQADSNSKERTHLEYVNRQNTGVISVGDEISIGTEHFYVVSSDEDKTVLLSKYNLYVGSTYSVDNGTRTKIYDITNETEGYGIQNADAVGVISSGGTRVATVPFSKIAYWLDTNENIKENYYDSTNTPQVYDETYSDSTGNNYSIAYYVLNYKNYLESIGANIQNARLLKLAELESLGCSSLSCTSVPTANQFVYSTSYWLQTSSTNSTNGIIQILKSTGEYRYFGYTYNYGTGVRPVIEIDSNYLLGNVTLSFDTNGGEETYSSRLLTVGTTYQNLPEPTREGYTFLGWNGKNRFNKENYLLLSDYPTVSSTGYNVAEINLESNKTYRISVVRYNDFDGTSNGYLLIDNTPNGNSAWTAIAHISLPNYSTKRFIYKTADNGLLYIARYANNQAQLNNIWNNTDVQIEEGTEATSFEPYYITNGTTIVQSKSHKLKAIWKEN